MVVGVPHYWVGGFFGEGKVGIALDSPCTLDLAVRARSPSWVILPASVVLVGVRH